jgi:hypothetical protein
VGIACSEDSPFHSPNRLPETDKPQVILIIDDLGDNFRLGKRIVNLPVPVNLAVLPNTPFARRLAELGHQRGHDIMLHFPMEATTRSDLLGKGAILTHHSQQQTLTIFENNLAQIPYVVGFNNHMGSELTQSQKHMRWIMQYAANKALYFVDSRTSPQSVAFQSAKESGVYAIGRDVFLDPASGSVTVEQQLVKALNIANKRGKVVIIGHPHPNTVAVLEREIPYLARDYQWVTVSQLVKRQYSHSKTGNTGNNSFCCSP